MTGFMTASPMGTPIGMMVSGETPLQPTIPDHRSYRPHGSEHEITKGNQCPGDQRTPSAYPSRSKSEALLVN